MKELIEYVAKSLVDKPESVRVSESVEGGEMVFRLEVDPEERGKVIGKGGRIARGIRTLLRIAALKRGSKARLEIV